VTIIEGNAFNVCESLESFSIPNSVSQIENGAFNNFETLKSVEVFWDQPLSVPNDIFNFGASLNTVTLTVPYGTKALYQTANVWKNFGTIIEREGNTTISVTGVSINAPQTTFTIGETADYSVTFTPTNVTNKNVTWSSSNTGVATVSDINAQTTTVTAKKAGSATINVVSQDGNKSASVDITITAQSTNNLTISIDEDVLIVGKTYNVSYTATGDFASGNQFIIQLQDRGQANNNWELARVTAKSGTKAITIPNVPEGSEYRIRVISTNPEIVGDNGSDLTVSEKITCSINAPSLKLGEKYVVTVHKQNITTDDSFVAYLSDENGSFAKQVSVGTAPGASGASSRAIEIMVPANTKSGKKYRIRVYSERQKTYSSDNGQDIAIGKPEELKEYWLTDNLTIYYDAWEQLSATRFKASGNVNVNKILYFDCPIEIERINSERAFIRGNGGMYVLDIKGQSYNLRNGIIYYEANKEWLNLIYTEQTITFALFQVAGMGVNVGNMEFDKSSSKDWLKLDYSLYNPTFPLKNILESEYSEYLKTSSGDLKIQKPSFISAKLKGAAYYSHKSGCQYSFDVALKDIDLKLFKLRELTVKFDPVKEEYSGTIEFSINVSKSLASGFSSFTSAPLYIVSNTGEILQETTVYDYLKSVSAAAATGNSDLTIEFGFEYKKGSFKFSASAGNLEIPIPGLPVIITKMSANYEYKDQGTVDHFGIGATIDIAPLKKELKAVIEGKDVGFQLYNPPFDLTIQGKLNLFSTEMANAKIGWNSGKKLFTLNGEMDILDIVVGAIDLNIYSNACNGQLYGYVHVPKTLTKYDFLSFLTDWKFNNRTIHWYNRYHDFELPVLWDKISCAGYYHGNGFPWFDFYWGKNLKDLGVTPRNLSPLRASSSSISFYLAESNTPKLYIMFWGDNSPVDFSLLSPSGKAYNKSNTLYQALEKNLQTVMAVEKPEYGEWKIIPNSSYENFKVFSLDAAPTVMFDKPLVKETSTDIRLLLNDFDDDLTVTFFYDTDKSGFDGIPVTEISGVHDAVLDYQWHPQDLSDGSYYIYCRVDDGKNTPVLLYAPGAISISNNITPAFDIVPQNVRLETNNNVVTVSWDASNDDKINYATVYYKNDKTEQVSGRVSDSTSVMLGDLIPGMRYQVWVTYTDTLDNESLISNIVEFTHSVNGNNIPYITSDEDYWVFREGERTKVTFNAYDVDDDNLSFDVLENISDYRFTSNTFTWKPAANEMSLKVLHIIVSDGMAKDTLQQPVRFLEKENQNISVSFATPVLYDANYHFVKIQNPLPPRSKFENILVQNKRTGYKIVLPCDKIADDLFMGKLVLTNDQNSFIPVQGGDTITLSYQYGGYTYTDYAVYSPVVTRAFRLHSGAVATLNAQQYAIPLETEETINQGFSIYPNPNQGNFNLKLDERDDIVHYTVTIYDTQGKLVYSCTDKYTTPQPKKISLNNLIPGIYIVHVSYLDRNGNQLLSNKEKMIVRE
jgi:hypothetical protein